MKTYQYYQLQFLEDGVWTDQEGMNRGFFVDLKDKVGALTPRERIIKRTITEEVVESGK